MFKPPIVVSKALMRDILKSGQITEPMAIISISTTPDDFLNIQIKNNVIGLLQLAFYDLDKEITLIDRKTNQEFITPLFNQSMAAQLAQFVYQMRNKVDLFFCHCEAGISRSAGAAAAIAKHFFDNDAFYYRRYRPNRLVYRLALNSLYNLSQQVGESQ